MFVVPEILWSPVSNFLYSFFKDSEPIVFRPNFLITSDFRNWLIFVVFIQLIGLICSLVLIIRSNINLANKILISLLFTFFLLLTAFVLFITFSLRNGVSF